MGFPTIAIAGRLDSAVSCDLTQLIKTVAATGTPERIGSAEGTFFRTATFLGKKAARTDNTSDAYLGLSSTDASQPYLIPSGGEITISAPVGAKYDLYDFYLDVGTNGDGVVVWYS